MTPESDSKRILCVIDETADSTWAPRNLPLAHQNRTELAIASDFRIDWAKSPEIPQKKGVWDSSKSQPEIAQIASDLSIALLNRNAALLSLASEIARDFWGPRWASQSQIAKIADFGALRICHCRRNHYLLNFKNIGWSRMSGRRTSGSSRPSLGVQVLAVFSFIS